MRPDDINNNLVVGVAAVVAGWLSLSGGHMQVCRCGLNSHKAPANRPVTTILYVHTASLMLADKRLRNGLGLDLQNILRQSYDNAEVTINL